MRFYFFTPSDMQVARVERQITARACEAMARYVDTVKVVAVKIRLSESEPVQEDDMYALYGVEPTFDFVLLPTRIHQDKWNIWEVVVALLRYSLYALREFVMVVEKENIVVYLKNFIYMAPFIIMRYFKNNIRIVYEIHSPPRKKYQEWLLGKADAIVANSYTLKEDISGMKSLRGKRILGLHQGVNLDYIESIRVSKRAARKRLGLPSDSFLVIYTGKVYSGYKEIDYYIEAAELLQGKANVVVVGGRADHVAKIRRLAAHLSNIQFVEFVAPSEIYYYHFAADALLLYYPPGIKLNKYRSPGKLFEYMASGNPIVAADYPVLEEVMEDGKTALLVERDNPQALVEGILRLKSDPDLAVRIAENARREVENYTWEKRARRIHEFLERI